MKQMKRKKYKILIVIIFMILGGNITIAQNGPPNPPDGDNTQNNKLGAIPISGGILLLLGAGAAYGSNFLRKKED